VDYFRLLSSTGLSADQSLSADSVLSNAAGSRAPRVRLVPDEGVESLVRGMLAGFMVQVVGQIETAPMKPEQARDYELLEARVRDRIAHGHEDPTSGRMLK
jgi:hypothetical protein